MTLAYPLMNEPIRFTENRVNVLVIENAVELRRFLLCLKEQINGLAGELVLGENGDVIELPKNAFLITDPFAIDFDSKKLLTKIAQDACSAGAEFAEDFVCVMAQLNKLAQQISSSLDYEASFDPVGSWDELVKIMGFHIDRETLSFPEQLLECIKLQRLFFGKKLFIFYNLKACLNSEELALFYRSVFYEKLNILLVEDAQRGASNFCENIIIVDKDLCII